MLHEKRFVIAGLSRLSVRVALRLAAARITVLRPSGEGDELVRLLPEGVDVVTAEAGHEFPYSETALDSAAAILALSEDDFANLRVAVVAKELAPNTPVVLRTFDPALADQLEDGLNVRRAYSVSSLAAPAFIAAACGDSVLETLRLGSGEVPIARVTVRAESPLTGKSPAQVKQQFGCAVVARCAQGDVWQSSTSSGDLLLEHEEILVGGPLFHVLRLIAINARWLREDGKRIPQRVKAVRKRRRGVRRLTHLPFVATTLGVILVIAIAVFAHALHLSLVDAIYFVVTTATTTGYGDISLKDSPAWLKLFGCAVMVTGGALLGVLFSYFASIATTERLEEWMGRRAERMSGHVVVAGLGNLGYRICRLLIDQGIDVAVIELSPRDRFVEAIRQRAPVLTGDARLPENLERASVRNAAAFIGGTTDDLANILACIQVRRLNPNVRTVGRVFDDALADRIAGAFAINQVLSASECAASAFVGAALDEAAVRAVTVGHLMIATCRYTVPAPTSMETVAAWRAEGVRVIAFSRDQTSLSPASELPEILEAEWQIVLCGPLEAVRRILSAD